MENYKDEYVKRLKDDCFVNLPVTIYSEFFYKQPAIINIQNCKDSDISFIANQWFKEKLHSESPCEDVYKANFLSWSYF